MNPVVTARQYARARGALWRDTGSHVLVLPTRSGEDVIVLGGGGAVLWRLLDHPMACSEIEDRLAGLAEAPPDTAAIESCLDELMSSGVISPVNETGAS